MIVLFPFQVLLFVSSEVLRCRLLKWLWAHPMNAAAALSSRPSNSNCSPCLQLWSPNISCDETSGVWHMTSTIWILYGQFSINSIRKHSNRGSRLTEPLLLHRLQGRPFWGPPFGARHLWAHQGAVFSRQTRLRGWRSMDTHSYIHALRTSMLVKS